jgi:hypothetical protein
VDLFDTFRSISRSLSIPLIRDLRRRVRCGGSLNWELRGVCVVQGNGLAVNTRFVHRPITFPKFFPGNRHYYAANAISSRPRLVLGRSWAASRRRSLILLVRRILLLTFVGGRTLTSPCLSCCQVRTVCCVHNSSHISGTLPSLLWHSLAEPTTERQAHSFSRVATTPLNLRGHHSALAGLRLHAGALLAAKTG